MIFVTVGSSQFPFDRLLRAVDQLDQDEDLVVQHGPSSVRPSAATCFEFLPFPEVARYVREARVVVCHGGVGSVLVALSERKRPLVVPRLARYRETTDDHQVDTALRFARAGLVTVVPNPSDLRDVLPGVVDGASAPLGREAQLVGELRDYLQRAIGRGRGGRGPRFSPAGSGRHQSPSRADRA